MSLGSPLTVPELHTKWKKSTRLDSSQERRSVPREETDDWLGSKNGRSIAIGNALDVVCNVVVFDDGKAVEAASIPSQLQHPWSWTLNRPGTKLDPLLLVDSQQRYLCGGPMLIGVQKLCMKTGLTDSVSHDGVDQTVSFGGSLVADNLKAKQKESQRQAIERYASLIRECSGEGTLAQGKCVHSQLVSDGWGHVTFLQNLLVEMYGRCGSLSEALSVFQGIEMPSIFSWTLVIAASSRNGDFGGALDLIRRMLLGGVKPDEAALVAVVNVAAGLEDIPFSRQVRAWVVEARHGCELVVGNALISMHCKCRDSGWAERVFYGMQETDVISWTSMAAAYAQNGQHAETLQLFHKMDLEGVKRNFVTFVTLVEACTRFLDLENGKVTHSRIKSSGFCSVVIVSNSLIHMYTKCGDLASAIDVFRGMADRNTISWTAMVAAYTQHGHCNEAIKHFQFMDLEGVKPDVVTLVAVVHACGGLMVLSKAREIHARVSDSGYLDSNVPLANAVISMYGRCGGLDDARDCFKRLRLKNTISWSSLIAIYAQDGQGEEAIQLFKLMVLDGVRPNSSSCASLLSAYSHEGDVHDCRECFAAIASDFGLEPTKDHFAGVVDLLARLGMLDRALELINTMPFFPDAAVFLALLSACCVHEDLELGRAAAEQAFSLDPADESSYVLLSNVYAALGVWGEVL